MPKVVWTEDFSVGVPELNEQHQKWIAMINDMHEALMTGAPADLKELGAQTLRSVLEYVALHFATEEEYLKTIHFPGFEEHHNLHLLFQEHIRDYLDRVRAGELVLNRHIMHEMMAWMQNHILTEDKKYASFNPGADRSR